MAPVLIRQFDVVRNPERRSSETIPFLIVLQADAVAGTRGIVVAPLVVADTIRGGDKLYPAVHVAGQRLVMIVTEIATAPRSLLRDPADNLLDDRDRIVAALNILFTGA